MAGKIWSQNGKQYPGNALNQEPPQRGTSPGMAVGPYRIPQSWQPRPQIPFRAPLSPGNGRGIA